MPNFFIVQLLVSYQVTGLLNVFIYHEEHREHEVSFFVVIIFLPAISEKLLHSTKQPPILKLIRAIT